MICPGLAGQGSVLHCKAADRENTLAGAHCRKANPGTTILGGTAGLGLGTFSSSEKRDAF
jgi:hypothetical protein